MRTLARSSKAFTHLFWLLSSYRCTEILPCVRINDDDNDDDDDDDVQVQS